MSAFDEDIDWGAILEDIEWGDIIKGVSKVGGSVMQANSAEDAAEAMEPYTRLGESASGSLEQYLSGNPGDFNNSLEMRANNAGIDAGRGALGYGMGPNSPAGSGQAAYQSIKPAQYGRVLQDYLGQRNTLADYGRRAGQRQGDFLEAEGTTRGQAWASAGDFAGNLATSYLKNAATSSLGSSAGVGTLAPTSSYTGSIGAGFGAGTGGSAAGLGTLAPSSSYAGSVGAGFGAGTGGAAGASAGMGAAVNPATMAGFGATAAAVGGVMAAPFAFRELISHTPMAPKKVNWNSVQNRMQSDLDSRSTDEIMGRMLFGQNGNAYQFMQGLDSGRFSPGGMANQPGYANLRKAWGGLSPTDAHNADDIRRFSLGNVGDDGGASDYARNRAIAGLSPEAQRLRADWGGVGA